jgi:uncharacterized membrane protein
MGLTLRSLKAAAQAAALAAMLAVSTVNPAEAARSGGRAGGSSFRAPAAPSRSYSAPSRGYSSPAPMYGGGYGGGYYGGGMGIGMPSLMYAPMMIGSGGGGLGTLLVAGTAASLAYRVLNERKEDAERASAVNPKTDVVTIKVGLLASARGLQMDLDMVGRSADTSTVRGLRYVLEETVLSLLRNPDYWVYGSIASESTTLDSAEDAFNRRCMQERLKISEETLTNVSGNRKEKARRAAAANPFAAPPDYIVVSLVCAAASADLARTLPKQINSAADLNRALGMLGGVSVDSLQAVEVIWAPQSLTDTLTETEMLADHPELRLI